MDFFLEFYRWNMYHNSYEWRKWNNDALTLSHSFQIVIVFIIMMISLINHWSSCHHHNNHLEQLNLLLIKEIIDYDYHNQFNLIWLSSWKSCFHTNILFGSIFNFISHRLYEHCVWTFRTLERVNGTHFKNHHYYYLDKNNQVIWLKSNQWTTLPQGL